MARAFVLLCLMVPGGPDGARVDQGSNSETTKPEEATPEGATEPKADAANGPGSEEFAAIKAKNEELLSDLKKLRDERREWKSADDDAKRKAGEFEPLYLEAKARNDELVTKLEADSRDAEAYRAWKKREEAAIDKAAESLSETARKALRGISDLDDRRALLQELTGAQPKPTPPEHPAADPSPQVAIDPAHVPENASKDNPKAWERFKDSIGVPKREHKKPVFAR